MKKVLQVNAWKMLSLQGIEDNEQAKDNFIIRTDINKIHREAYLLQEAEEEFQVSLEEEAEKDLVEEEDMDLEKGNNHIVIIVTNLVILRKIVMKNCVIMNIKVPIQFLKKP